MPEATVTKRNAGKTSSVPPTTSNASPPQAEQSTAAEGHEKIADSGLLNPTGVKTLLVFVILSCICITGFMVRLFSVIRYESIIHEFDPW